MIDRTTWMQKDIPPKPKPVSNKILGIGVVLAGGVVLAVALIIGLEFPRHVREKVKDDQCILGEDHAKYDEWTEDEFYARYDRVYYWVIINRDNFLFNGDPPKIRQKGPYVYKKTQRKVDVHFNGRTLSYAIMTSQQFQPALTKSECGSHCSQHDELTIMNDSFLKKITEFENDENLFLSLIPGWLTEVHKQLLSLYDNNADLVYSIFGGLNLDNVTVGSMNFQLIDFVFGSWIGKNDTIYKSDILLFRNQSEFHVREMKGLHAVLLDQNRLGVTQQQLTQNNLCASSTSSTLRQDESLSNCGLLYLLRKAHENFEEAVESNYTRAIVDMLCTSATVCFDISDGGANITKAYIDAMYYFIDNVMYAITSDVLLSGLHNQITITKRQHELAVGYRSSDITGGEFIPGILPHNDGMTQSLSSLDRVTVKTCYDVQDITHNMEIVGFKSSRLNVQSDNVDGFNDFTTISTKLKACEPCIASSEQFKFYVPDLRRSARFDRLGEDHNHDVHIVRYRMSIDNFNAGEDDVTEPGLLNVTRYTSYLSWFSTPHFYGFEENVTSVALLPSSEDYSSMVDVEDITGRVWKKVIRLQYNVGLEEQRLKALRSLRLSINFFQLPIPVYWIEEMSEINPLHVDYYHYKVTRLMQVSCGGLIGIAIIAIVVVAVGVVITFVPLGLGRVAPMPHDVELQSH